MAVSQVLMVLLSTALSFSSAQTTVATPAPPACPEGWIEFDGSCYYVVNSPLDWFGADKYCTLFDPTQYRVHLVSIETPNEQLFLAEVLRIIGQPGMSYWTSGNIIDRRSGYVWARTNKPFNYLAWGPNEPDGEGSCVQLWGDQGYLWDDADCEWWDTNFICEVSIENAAKIFSQ